MQGAPGFGKVEVRPIGRVGDQGMDVLQCGSNDARIALVQRDAVPDLYTGRLQPHAVLLAMCPLALGGGGEKAVASHRFLPYRDRMHTVT
jgi:hypothetical protein